MSLTLTILQVLDSLSTYPCTSTSGFILESSMPNKFENVIYIDFDPRDDGSINPTRSARNLVQVLEWCDHGILKVSKLCQALSGALSSLDNNPSKAACGLPLKYLSCIPFCYFIAIWTISSLVNSLFMTLSIIDALFSHLHTTCFSYLPASAVLLSELLKGFIITLIHSPVLSSDHPQCYLWHITWNLLSFPCCYSPPVASTIGHPTHSRWPIQALCMALQCIRHFR